MQGVLNFSAPPLFAPDGQNGHQSDSVESVTTTTGPSESATVTVGPIQSARVTESVGSVTMPALTLPVAGSISAAAAPFVARAPRAASSRC